MGHVKGRAPRLLTLVAVGGIINAASLPSAALPPPVRLSQTGLATSDVDTAKISPDGSFVVYAHDDQLNDYYRLYSVPTGGGTPVALSLVSSALDEVPKFAISPDSSRVVFAGYFASATRRDMYSVPIGGPVSSSVLLSTDVLRISTENLITPNGAKVIFRCDFNGDGDYQVCAVPIAGPSTAAVALSAAPTAEATGIVGISPDSTRVVFESGTSDPVGLLSVPIGTGPSPAVDLSPAVDYSGDAGTLSLEFSPNGQRVVYVWSGVSPSIREYLYSAPVAGPSGHAVQLDSAVLQTGLDFSISPDSSTVVFSGWSPGAPAQEYAVQVPIAGPNAAAHLLSNGARYVRGTVICPDGATVLYRETDADTSRLFSIALGASPASRVELSRDPGSGLGLKSFALEPYGRRAVYLGDNYLSGWFMGFRAPVHGPPGHDEIIWTRPVDSFSTFYRISSSGAAVVVIGVEAFDPHPGPVTDHVWAVPLIGDPLPEAWELSPKTQSEPIRLVGISANDKWAVYIADANTAEKMELFSVEIPMAFADDFETGDTAVWSSTVH